MLSLGYVFKDDKLAAEYGSGIRREVWADEMDLAARVQMVLTAMKAG